MFKFIASIFSAIWAVISWLRAAFFNLIFLIILAAIITAIVNAPKPHVPNHIALNIAPEGFLVDQLTYEASPADLVLGSDGRRLETSLIDLVDTINHAATDDRITSMVLNLTKFAGGGISKMEELGQALEQFKAAGKPIYAYGDNLSQQQYFLASFADTIYLNEMGSVLITGFGMYQNYFKDAADKLSVDFHVFRVGQYKDAVEPFMRNDMSPASREHNSRWLNELWNTYVNRVTGNRQLAPGAIDSYLASLTDANETNEDSQAEKALQAGLVDKLVSRVDVRQLLAEKVGASDDGETYDAIGYEEYRQATQLELPSGGKTLGLIVAQGNIVGGDQPNGVIGSASLTELIRRARDDDSIAAIVLRIDSGGGSAFASEVIRQEILNTRKSGKPVYISMGSMAASGGYWVASAGDEIWATPSTLTGSIGVWGLIPNLANALNKLGVHSDGVGTTELADIYHPDRPLSAPAKQLIQSGINDVYDHFLNIVAEARDSDPASVHEIAQGRVWSGEAAASLGLVDKLGTLHDTLDAVAEHIGAGSYRVKQIKRELTPTEEIMHALMQEVSVSGLVDQHSQLGSLAALFDTSPVGNLAKLMQKVQWSYNDGEQPEIMAFCMVCNPT